MLADRCVSVCLVCMSVTLVYCGQTVGWIKMKLGTEVGPGYIVLDGDPAPPRQKGTDSTFRPMFIVAKRSPISATVELSTCHQVIRFLQVSAVADEPCDAMRHGQRIVKKGGRSVRSTCDGPTKLTTLRSTRTAAN